MSQSIDRLENLIRVLRGVKVRFNLSNWCDCAVGHACRDQYFIDEGLTIASLGNHPIAGAAQFFGIDNIHAYATFLASGYVGPAVLGHLPADAKMPTPADVIARLQVLLLEKRGAEALAVEMQANEPLVGPDPPGREEWGGLTSPQAARELEPV